MNDRRDLSGENLREERATQNEKKQGVLKSTILNFSAHKATQMAAAIAFYTIFSLGPILIIVVSVAGLVWGERAVQGEIVGQAQEAIGEDAARMLQTVLANAASTGQGILGLAIGIGSLIISATVVLVQLKDALNTVWGVKAKSGRPIRSVLRDRGLAFVLVLVVGAILAASLLASSLASGLAERIGSPIAVQAVELLVSALVIALVFALVFRYLPDGRIDWSAVWVGAAVSAALFVIGKFGLGIYLGRVSVASAYGAAGGLILLLLWVYYSTMIFLLGAEFTCAWARKKGERPVPTNIAEYA